MNKQEIAEELKRCEKFRVECEIEPDNVYKPEKVLPIVKRAIEILENEEISENTGLT